MDHADRSRRFRALAAETASLSRLYDDPETRSAYQQISEHWAALAEEVEAMRPDLEGRPQPLGSSPVSPAADTAERHLSNGL
jgi:hypothetical protein